LPFLLSLRLYFYIILSACGFFAYRYHWFNVKNHMTADKYIKSQDCNDWMNESRKDDSRHGSLDVVVTQ